MKQYNYIAQFANWWGKQKLVYFVIIGLVFYQIIIYIAYSLLSLFIASIDADSQALTGKIFGGVFSYIMNFIMLCIASPFVETLFFQNVLIRLIRRYLSKKIVWQVLLSGLCFGLVHFLNPAYILLGFVVGNFFSYCFILYEKHTNTNRATLAVGVLHALINCIPFFKKLYLNILF